MAFNSNSPTGSTIHGMLDLNSRADEGFVQAWLRRRAERTRYWYDNLTSSNGKCRSFADSFSVSDVDWDTEDGHYRVLLHGEWINVPNSSVVAEPSRYGPAVVWPYMDSNGNIYIRCFLPGAGA